MVKIDSQTTKKQVINLWHEAFGDSEEYINFFLDTHSSCICLTECENRTLCSMLFLIDGALKGVNGYYLFAAATSKAKRGKGYMARLLKKAQEYAKQQGKSFIALVPAQGSLFDYYSRFGYKTAFYARLQPVNESFTKQNANIFKWCKAHTDYIEAESERFGTKLFEDNGNLFSVYAGDKIKVPVENKDENSRYGMLLPLDKKAEDLITENSYIGLTLE